MAWDEWSLSARPLGTQWVKKIGARCVEESLHTGIYPSVTIAQSILESHAGTSDLAVYHYNFFGMMLPQRLVGKTAVFWDGSVYTRANYVFERSWADYRQAGDPDAGFLLSLRHYGMNFWMTEAYAEHGVLRHVSSMLSPAEAEKDAKRQLFQLAEIYAPAYDHNDSYAEQVWSIIGLYDLLRYDARFLSCGGWNGDRPYSL